MMAGLGLPWFAVRRHELGRIYLPPTTTSGGGYPGVSGEQARSLSRATNPWSPHPHPLKPGVPGPAQAPVSPDPGAQAGQV